MEVFVRNIPDQGTEKQLKKIFQSCFKEFRIDVFECHKLRSRGCALLTIPDRKKAELFLAAYAAPTNRKLLYMTRPMYCSKSKNEPDKFLLQTLQKEAKDKAVKGTAASGSTGRSEREFGYNIMSCGLWDYHGSDLVFVAHFQSMRRGSIMFGKKAMALLMDPTSAESFRHRLDFPFSSMQSITIGSHQEPSLTFTLSEAPRIYKEEVQDQELANTLRALSLHIAWQDKPKVSKRIRITSISKAHGGIVGSCFVYRVLLSDVRGVHRIKSLLREGKELPPSVPWPTSVISPKYDFDSQMAQLISVLHSECDSLDFGIKFQVQRLAQNGYLAPTRVIELLPEIIRMFYRSGGSTSVDALRRLFKQIPFAGPETTAEVFTVESLSKVLCNNEKASIAERSFTLNHAKQYSHICPVYRATVTPTGTYLEGPEPETMNRVLRKYSKLTDCFLRVSFLDEDSEPVRFDRFVSLEEIYHSRFKDVLEGSINIAGRYYEFLGFSHSALRDQSCWFSCPFECDGYELNARAIIAKLGDFSTIRSPAKCAARIGQAFSDTNGSVKLPVTAVGALPDVERNGRVFSDGCATFSSDILERIWHDYAPARGLNPTLFQVRIAGAKGMISLDSRLEGEILFLRPSMIKFTGSDIYDIEICGSGARPLPMYLNRQYIKIMEDLGVEPEVFMELQNDAVDQLRQTTVSPLNASSFIRRNNIGKAARLPWFIKKLYYLGLTFLEDPFLRNTIELAVLIQLRELKHRSRILIEKGVTLYGIMDETGYLPEGTIYACTDNDVILGRVTIARAPALHPGDIQLVTAIDVPDNSPLTALNNCVVFSQYGKRDLPSQLSGGDLDGDLYNVIWDTRLQPKFVVGPAEYPRVSPKDIERPVEKKDMTDHFILFMENDQLGRLATLHVQLADQKERGTHDPDCIKLAEMHSTAVDFSKTGIPVEMAQCPQYRRFRPDFQAPGPHVKIEKDLKVVDGRPSENTDEDDEDIVTALDPGTSKYRYYESHKVLGRLYRAIDETDFLADIQKHARNSNISDTSGGTMIGRLWDYVVNETRLVQWVHHRDWARDIKEAYEAITLDTMYSSSPHSIHPLTELEVFVGTVLGKSGGLQTRRLREASVSMKEKFERDIAFTVECIVKGPNGEREEALERSIACLSVALEEATDSLVKVGKLVSFRYVAAAICLRELEGFQKLAASSFLT